MQRADSKQHKLIYGLDIGTRSIVGTVGYMEKDHFVVVAQKVREHETRAMLDGQIHDIGAVGEMIRDVTDELEKELDITLSQVCIAAAGRVLQTVTTSVEIDLEGEKLITKEDIFALDSYGIEKAYEEFQKENELDMKFYCVGYTVMRYYMNHYPMSNLENHKAKIIAADLIATFLPDDVVDGLYKAVELAGLEVANLTLEPIAAMAVAIPQMYRMLNIALIDVGAGTSDISITKDGSIVAYGMLPVAGYCLTEDIARHCLVDFTTAEMIKRGIEHSDTVEYKDIMGLPQTISKEEVLSVCSDHLTEMAEQAADKIMELNGDKPVSAVFVVGGGGKIEGYTQLVADRLGIARERCALRGEEVMQKIDFLPGDIKKDSMLVTPVGICLNYYEQSNNFVFVTLNGERVKLYDNNRLAVVDAAIQAEIPNDALFPKRGETLTFTFNGKQKMIRGERGESAVILLNGEPADIHTPIRGNDRIEIKESTAGAPAALELGKLAEYNQEIHITVNGQSITLPKFASANGELQSAFYQIREGDEIELLNYYTVQQVTEVMDVMLDPAMQILINHEPAGIDSKVYDNFTLEWKLAEKKTVETKEPEQETEAGTAVEANAEIEAGSELVKPAKTVIADAGGEKQEQPDGSDAQESRKTNRPGGSMLEKARQSAQQIANAPITEEVEEELKQMRANAAAERIAAFATAYNSGQGMPQPVQISQPTKPVQMSMQMAAQAQPSPEPVQAQITTQHEQLKPVQSPVQAQQEPVSQVEQMPPAQQKPVQEQPPVQRALQEQAQVQPPADAITAVTVTVNGEKLTLTGKKDYIYVDVFDHIDFDLSKPKGKTVETLINGRKAQYVEPLKTGDVLDIFWKD